MVLKNSAIFEERMETLTLMKQTLKAIAASLFITAFFAFSASAQKGNYSIPDENVHGYLFAHKSAHGDWPAFATSPDAIHFHDLLCGDSVFSTDSSRVRGTVQNVFLSRRAGGRGFVMLTTQENGAMTLQTSDDLIAWTTAASPEISPPRNAKLIWDGSQYILYYVHSASGQALYSALNEGLAQVEAEKPLFDWGQAVSDMEIFYGGDDDSGKGSYRMVVKLADGRPGILTSASPDVTGVWEKPAENLTDGSSYFQVEGDHDTGNFASLKIPEQEGWQFGYVDRTTGGYRLCLSNGDLSRFWGAKNIEGIYGPDQGSFITLNQAEYEKLQAWSDEAEPKHLAKNVKNPVFPGLHADPEVLYSEKTGKYYIYPTTDGAYAWHSFDFHCFSSPDLKNWTDEGVILDLRNLNWGDRAYAWAPCIIEKPVYKNAKKTKIAGYKYYFYFVHHGTIGVAVADSPEGPFEDVLGKALLSQEEINAPNQIIDPDVFRDPASGKYYLYWGNSYLWMAELADDMVSLVPGTMKELIPRSKIGEYHYLEGSHVFERNGLYYFMWSENITRSSYYRVRYLISDSPTEFIRNGKPAKVEETIVVQQDPSKQIFGTGHHSVINVPGTDQWYLVYHRFNRPGGVKLGLSGGYNREVCIDPLYFNPDGTIVPVKPSL